MGAVYRALDPFLEREVALKVMLPQVAEDPDQKQRFEREARAVARLSHPNVVTVFDLGYHTDGAPYIVMELLRGDDLLHITSQGPPVALAEKVSIVLQVLRGLGQAHRVGIVHRDIKPANVFITDDGTAKIMDFGVARLGSSLATGVGAIVGTAAYMSPEQVRGEPVDGRSDIFSVASMLCELLSGRRPFHEETPVATLYSIAQKEPSLELPSGAEYERFVPVLKRALAKDREERFATCDDFADALSSCLDEASPTVRGRSIPVRRDEGSGKGTAVGLKTTKPLVPPALEAHAAPATGTPPSAAGPIRAASSGS
jgi:serine/threonine protein kinase